jgi:hypothetical protein
MIDDDYYSSLLRSVVWRESPRAAYGLRLPARFRPGPALIGVPREGPSLLLGSAAQAFSMRNGGVARRWIMVMEAGGWSPFKHGYTTITQHTLSSARRSRYELTARADYYSAHPGPQDSPSLCYSASCIFIFIFYFYFYFMKK